MLASGLSFTGIMLGDIADAEGLGFSPWCLGGNGGMEPQSSP